MSEYVEIDCWISGYLERDALGFILVNGSNLVALLLKMLAQSVKI